MGFLVWLVICVLCVGFGCYMLWMGIGCVVEYLWIVLLSIFLIVVS